jgi:hypothetical protein
MASQFGSSNSLPIVVKGTEGWCVASRFQLGGLMKYWIIGLMSLVGANAFAVQVTSAELDAELKNIVVSVTYGGGCSSHKFSLKMGKCTRSFPVHCTAVVTDRTDDHCRALFFRKIVFSLEEYGLNSQYFSGATLRIRGDGDTRSSALVVLPEWASQ